MYGWAAGSPSVSEGDTPASGGAGFSLREPGGGLASRLSHLELAQSGVLVSGLL